MGEKKGGLYRLFFVLSRTGCPLLWPPYLLVGRDALLVLDLGLDVLDRVRRLDIERDGLARQRLDEDLHDGYVSCSFVFS